MSFLLSLRNAVVVFRQENCKRILLSVSLTPLSLCVRKRGVVRRLGLMLVTLSLAYIRTEQ